MVPLRVVLHSYPYLDDVRHRLRRRASRPALPALLEVLEGAKAALLANRLQALVASEFPIFQHQDR